MENYLMLNGKRIDLTEEQVKILGFEEKKDCFTRNVDGAYFYITAQGNVTNDFESYGCVTSGCRYNVGNYCTDESLMKQRALHEILDRLLWRFSMQNDGDKIDWNDGSYKYYIYHTNEPDAFLIDRATACKRFLIYFHTREIAQRAIKEIVFPFMDKHPEFVW